MITNYSRDHIKALVNDGVSPAEALRDYDIIKAIIAGKKVDEIIKEHRISRAQVFNIKKKYMR